MPERPYKVVPVSEHLFKIRDDALYQPPSTVSEHLYVSDSMLKKIYSLGEDPLDFLHNAGGFLRRAIDRATEESASPVCRKGHDCRGCIGGSYGNSKSFVRPQSSDFPNVDLGITVSCDNAMARQADPNLMGPTSVDLTRVVGASGRKPEYTGVRVFDSGCHVEMVGRAVLTSEIIADEVGL